MRKRRTVSLAFAGVSMFALAAASPVVAAEVTPERLINANKEPHNWLMNHRTYDAQRFSPLDAINEGNVKGLRLAYAVALGNSAGKEYNEATALAEDGFLYITDSWGVLYKIDVTSGDAGRMVWRMDPKQERQSANRGAAFWGNLVITPANAPARIIATDKTPAKSCGRRTSPKTWRNCRSPARFCRSRTRSSSARRAATAAFATGSLRLMPQLERSFGSNTRSRRRASRAARPGKTRTMPGRPAAAPYG
jgi:hypothetical protein